MATTNSPALLLDTCAAIWIVEDAPISAHARETLTRAYRDGRTVLISSITAWEMGILMARNRFRSVATPEAWFRQLVSRPGFSEVVLTSDVLVRSSFLPGSPPRDPADRIIAATAREWGIPLMTRDRLLLGYAREGYIAAVEC